MSYNIPKVFISEFQSYKLELRISKLTLVILLTLIAPKGGVKILSLLLGMFYNMPKMLSSEFESHSIKIEDFKINLINPLNSNITKGGNIKPITKRLK